MPDYYVEMAKKKDVKREVITHCDINHFIRSAYRAGWVITNCMEVEDKETFIAQYSEVSPPRREASEAEAELMLEMMGDHLPRGSICTAN